METTPDNEAPRLRHLVRTFNLETAVGRARVARDAVRWQDATTRRAHAREEEQRDPRAAARLSRVRSALTQLLRVVGGRDLSVHGASSSVTRTLF